jgi:hypothetical protein
MFQSTGLQTINAEPPASSLEAPYLLEDAFDSANSQRALITNKLVAN